MSNSEDFKLTRGVKQLIKDAIGTTQSNNRYVLCEKIADVVEKKYEGLNLDYQLERMNIETTKQILKAIDIYFYKHFKPSEIPSVEVVSI